MLTALLHTPPEAPTCMGHHIHRFDIPFRLAEARRLDVCPSDCTDFIDTATSPLHDASHDAYVTHLILQALRRIV